MSQIVERSQADYIKSLEKQISTQEIDVNTTQEAAYTTTQELDDEHNDSVTQEVSDESDATTYFHEAHCLAHQGIRKICHETSFPNFNHLLAS